MGGGMPHVNDEQQHTDSRHLLPDPRSRQTGKSSLAVQFVDGHFVESYYPTIENTFSKEIRFKGQDFMTEIVDTAGQDEYSILNSKHFIGIHGYMIVYSVASLTSFEMVRTIRDKIIHHLVSAALLPEAALPFANVWPVFLLFSRLAGCVTSPRALVVMDGPNKQTGCERKRRSHRHRREQERLEAGAAPGQPGRRAGACQRT